jgi:uncharacterized protein
MNPTVLIGLVVALVLTGCGSTSSSRFYTLNALPQDPAVAPSDVAVLVGPVTVADYLARPQMVRRSGPQELEFDEYHRWAEPLDRLLARVLTQDLAALLGSGYVMQFPWKGQRPFDHRVEVLLTRFEEDSQGRAVVELRWTLVHEDAPAEARTLLYRTESEAGARTQPAGLAAALDESFAAFARELADTIRNARPAPQATP